MPPTAYHPGGETTWAVLVVDVLLLSISCEYSLMLKNPGSTCLGRTDPAGQNMSSLPHAILVSLVVGGCGWDVQ